MRKHGQLYCNTTARVTSPSLSAGRRCAGPEPGRRPVAGGQVEMQTHVEVQLSAPPIPAHLPFQIHRTVMFDTHTQTHTYPAVCPTTYAYVYAMS